MKYRVAKRAHTGYEIRAEIDSTHSDVVAIGPRALIEIWAWAANAVADNMTLQAWPNSPSAPGAREYTGPTEGIR